uniref:G-protein coupled receptors family 1 profile domain-containing protein n=1 Tax=Neogobius melanostomus TaxID=47308 RepID=A0A8C6WIF3_9GOBI
VFWITLIEVSHFTLGAYFDTGPLRWLYFVLTLSVYVLILLSNLLLIVVICLNRTLHEPMYIFLCSLLLNELYGSTALFPLLLFQIPQDVHTITTSFCFLQIFFVHTYTVIEFMTLAVISYDRYLAICFPLQYILVVVLLTTPLKLCGNIITKVYCNNYSVVKLSCSDTSVNNIYGLIITIITVFGPLIFILATYIRILKVCFNGSKQTRQKALATCGPHLASIVNYSSGAFFEVLGSRFDLSNVHSVIRVILSLYFLAPVLNPIMYGLKITAVRRPLKMNSGRLFMVKQV